MKALLILLSLLVASLEADAQNWVRTAGPVEDDVHDLCIDSSGILYAVTSLGVNRSTDRGATWTRPFLFPQSTMDGRVMVAPNGNIIASSDRRIFVSSDQGVAFTTTHIDSTVNTVLQFATSGDGRIFAIRNHELKLSVNNGSTWVNSSIAGLPWPTWFEAIVAMRDALFIVANYDFYSSHNGGKSWNSIGSSPAGDKLLVHPSGKILSVYSSGYGEGRIDQYRDGQWDVFGPFHHGSRLFTADMMRDGTMLVSGDNGLYLMKNLQNLVDISHGFDNIDSVYRRVTRFIEDPRNKLYYAATLGAGVWKSRTMLNVNPEHAPRSFLVTPNPARERVTIEYTATEYTPVTIKLYDILGRTLWRRTETAATGQNSVSFDAESLLPGSYLIVLEVSGEVRTQWVSIL